MLLMLLVPMLVMLLMLMSSYMDVHDVDVDVVDAAVVHLMFRVLCNCLPSGSLDLEYSRV